MTYDVRTIFYYYNCTPLKDSNILKQLQLHGKLLKLKFQFYCICAHIELLKMRLLSMNILDTPKTKKGYMVLNN
jgi:hypothetical protein